MTDSTDFDAYIEARNKKRKQRNTKILIGTITIIIIIAIIRLITYKPETLEEKVNSIATSMTIMMKKALQEKDINKYLSYFTSPETERANNSWLLELSKYPYVDITLELDKAKLKIFPNGLVEITAFLKREIGVSKTSSDSFKYLVDDHVTYYFQKYGPAWRISSVKYQY